MSEFASFNSLKFEEISGQNEYERRRAHTQRCAVEMGKLFTSGHDAQQTPAYEAWRMKYLQAMVDEKYSDLPEGEHSHWTTG